MLGGSDAARRDETERQVCRGGRCGLGGADGPVQKAVVGGWGIKSKEPVVKAAAIKKGAYRTGRGVKTGERKGRK